jgi:hypothetical protein
MQRAKWFLGMSLAVLTIVCLFAIRVQAGQAEGRSGYRVLSPISSGNLTIFPVVTRNEYDTSMFITLDEGLRSGEVEVTEAGSVQPLVRRGVPTRRYDGARVNQLVLVNKSKHPLLLLAGEIVTGGKQDRVIAKDRIVPAMSDPIDLGVFCVEPGRWVAKTDKFGGFSGLAAPNVRRNAMVLKDQEQVWNAVRQSQARAAEAISSGAAVGGPSSFPSPAVAEINRTTSYARVMQNSEVEKKVDEIAAPIQRSFQAMIRELRARNAVGVVAAVNGQILWADIFASTDLLEKYWPKLIRSYAAEAMTRGGRGGKVSDSGAQAFVDRLDGTHETADTEPGVYRQAEISGADYTVFALTSLLPKANYTVHLAKMSEPDVAWKVDRQIIPVR